MSSCSAVNKVIVAGYVDADSAGDFEVYYRLCFYIGRGPPIFYKSIVHNLYYLYYKYSLWQ